MRDRKGFTLLEVQMAALILGGVLVALLGIYIYCLDLQETSRNTTFVWNAARSQMEHQKSLWPPVASDNALTGLNGRLRVEVSACVYPAGAGADECQLYNVRVVGGWVQRGKRIFGEGELNSSGQFTFSDLDNDGVIESPVAIDGAVANMS